MITQPEQMWQYLAQARGAETRPDAVQKNYYLPLLGYMSLVVFLCAAFRGPETDVTFDYQYGMKQMVPLLIAYFLGPLVAILVFNLSLRHLFGMEDPDKDRVQLFVFYCTSFLMALEILEALIPSIRFLGLIFVYLVYITFSGASTYIRVEHNQRWKAGFVAFLLIWSCPNIIIMLMHKMQA